MLWVVKKRLRLKFPNKGIMFRLWKRISEPCVRTWNGILRSRKLPLFTKNRITDTAGLKTLMCDPKRFEFFIREEWRSLKSTFKIKSKRTFKKTGEPRTSTRYYLSSLGNVKPISRAFRQHWEWRTNCIGVLILSLMKPTAANEWVIKINNVQGSIKFSKVIPKSTMPRISPTRMPW